jgi:hypothetical protein
LKFYEEFPPAYIIVTNQSYGALPTSIAAGDYILHSIITFEEIAHKEDLFINHFMCIGLARDGYYIYDDLLNLNGGFQGGFVPQTSPSYQPDLELFFKHVPILIFRHKSIILEN